MVTLEQIYSKYEAAGIPIFYWPTHFKAATIELDGDFSVFVDCLRCDSIVDLMWTLCHEYGHCATGATHRLSSPYDLIEKHEFKANKKAAFTFLPPEDFAAAFNAGLREPWELAEWFSVPEQQVVAAWQYYTENAML